MAILLSQAAIVPAANAATINVGVGGADCTLSDAIRSANQDTVIGSCTAGSIGADTINIPSQTIMFASAAVDGAQYGDSALPIVESIITIEGNGSTLERIGADPFRIIATDPSSSAFLTLNSITLTNGYAVNGSEGYGGALYAGGDSSVTINNSTIKDSSSLYAGGAIYAFESRVRINNTTITGNYAEYGGGIWATENTDIVISESVISGNSAQGGGGIYMNQSLTLKIIDTTVTNNTAIDSGGGISLYNGNNYVQLDVIGSTISNNTVSGITVGSQKGGGIVSYRGDINITNSTVSGNFANGRGSGLYINAATLNMRNTTVSDNLNVSSIAFSGNYTYPTSATLLNTVVANSPGNIDCYVQGVDVTLTADSSNWFESTTCNGVDSGDPMLGGLADNGGPTYTHLPGVTSGLESAGAVNICGSVGGRDQRGEFRGTDSCFIGAVEPFADGSINFFVVPLPSGKSVIFGL